jgi:ribulose-5-phosphate 4-epimerase/fuculose-1-phosphate aldolase
MISLKQVSLAVCILASAVVLANAQSNSGTQRPPDTDEQRIADLVLASRILVNEGVLDSFGHVSVRSLKDPTHFFMPRAMPPALVTAKDIIELNSDAEPIAPNSPRPNGEKFIHSEIYKARPDVQAIAHAHSPAVIPFSLTPRKPLRPVLHTAGFLPERVSVFDHREVSKDDPSQRGKLLVSNAKLGGALAKKLGPDTVVLIRGHGVVAVGETLPWVVLRAVYTQINARTLLDALSIDDEITYLNEDEIKYHRNELVPDRPWANFKARLPQTP